MNKRESHSFDMFKATEHLLTNNFEIIKPYQPIVAAYERLKSDNAELERLVKVQAEGTVLKSEMKGREKEDLNTLVERVTDAMTAHAATINNPELRHIAHWDKTLLKRLKEVDYVTKIQAIYQAALPIAGELAVWGVSAGEVEMLNYKSGQLMKRTPEIRNVKVVSKQASEEIHQKVAEVKKDLAETMDALMKPLDKINPTFYGQYLNARIVLGKAPSAAERAKRKTLKEAKAKAKEAGTDTATVVES